MIFRTAIYRTWASLSLLKRHYFFLSLHWLSWLLHPLSLRPIFEFFKPVSNPRQVVVQHPLLLLLSWCLITSHIKFNFFQKLNEFLVLRELRYRFRAFPNIHLANGLHVFLLSIVNLVIVAHVDFLLDGGDVTRSAGGQGVACSAHGGNGRLSNHAASLNSLKLYVSVGWPCKSQQGVHPTCFSFVMLGVFDKLAEPLPHHWVNQASM